MLILCHSNGCSFTRKDHFMMRSNFHTFIPKRVCKFSPAHSVSQKKKKKKKRENKLKKNNNLKIINGALTKRASLAETLEMVKGQWGEEHRLRGGGRLSGQSHGFA
ncbi:hypothetical protein POVWA1_027370 [Plasmodium ovale wallikeri]|uniref:Uncharacterized protein n=1 Tax=Plasmodium ovale wallikeri TaxID=864142 RepID=A0A1A8YV83_PLAOA|nr:hypothetical protein POVWA1_027370 [Plasmodium ovale wallikeri]